MCVLPGTELSFMDDVRRQLACVEVLKLDVAERADVIVEMNNPGVWVFGSTDDEDRNMGMGVVIEYKNRQGEPQWIKPTKDDWAYATNGSRLRAAAASRSSSSKASSASASSWIRQWRDRCAAAQPAPGCADGLPVAVARDA
jgi:hypothetical protein